MPSILTSPRSGHSKLVENKRALSSTEWDLKLRIKFSNLRVFIGTLQELPFIFLLEVRGQGGQDRFIPQKMESNLSLVASPSITKKVYCRCSLFMFSPASVSSTRDSVSSCCKMGFPFSLPLETKSTRYASFAR